ncbi:hypothetical protein AR1_183 [Escherichia phage AR1]|uniref:Uncharacterized protein n=1 Tax=Escherichia phage AR1 TaxID=66711 RepID=D4Z9X9_BPAR1|nr:hypothetical protein AR1_183 [Escherichia phage AR1]BAI83191.1 hypothetical protein AR1_183 [Escherichia phage AR1]
MKCKHHNFSSHNQSHVIELVPLYTSFSDCVLCAFKMKKGAEAPFDYG